MALNYIGNDTDGVDVASDNDLWVLSEGSTLSNTGDAFDFQNFRYVELIIEGSVYSQSDAVTSGDASVLFIYNFNTVVVSETGLVAGNNGITITGHRHFVVNSGEIRGLTYDGIDSRGDRSEISNDGSIHGSTFGITLVGDSNEVRNTGTVSSDNFAGIYVNGTGNTVFNSGTIVGGSYGVQFYPYAGDENSLTNIGTIAGTGPKGIGVIGFSSNETIVNAGLIVGDVILYDGDDTYDGSGGEVLGIVNGGGGRDRLTGGDGDDIMLGETQRDIMRGGDGDDTLEGGAGADTLRGQAGDDTLEANGGRDTVRGAIGNDTLLGNAGSDTVLGGQGDDVLDGGKGDDTLNGGRDNDLLTGGKGTDIFEFWRAAGDDTITDFEDGTDQIDLSAFGKNFNAVDGAISNNGGNAFIDLSQLGGDGIVLVEGAAGDLDASDFIL